MILAKESEDASDAGRNNKKKKKTGLISFYKFLYSVKLHSAQTFTKILTNFQY